MRSAMTAAGTTQVTTATVVLVWSIWPVYRGEPTYKALLTGSSHRRREISAERTMRMETCTCDVCGSGPSYGRGWKSCRNE